MQEETSSRAEDIDLQSVLDYLGSLNPKPCDFCGKTQWTVFNDGNGHPSVGEPCLQISTADNRPSVAIGGAVPMIQVQCMNCGQLKYFSLSAVIRKIKEGKPGHAK